MFPTLRQRLLITVAVILGALVWSSAAPALAAADGLPGLSLLDSMGDPAKALLLLLLWALPALLLAALCSSCGNPLAGLFVAGLTLTTLAWRGGPIDGWLYRHDLPRDYSLLLAEMLLWQSLNLILLLLIGPLRLRLRRVLPPLAWQDHFGEDQPLLRLDGRSLAASGLCTLIAGAVGLILIRRSDSSQVILTLILAFTLGALVSTLVFPRASILSLLLSPLLLALASYLYMLARYSSSAQVLAAWFDQQLPLTSRLPGLALTLPIQFAAAGLTGVALGMGWGQALHVHGQHNPAPAASSGA